MIELTTGDILKVDSDAIVGGAPQADKAVMRTELDQWKTEYSDLLK